MNEAQEKNGAVLPNSYFAASTKGQGFSLEQVLRVELQARKDHYL